MSGEKFTFNFDSLTKAQQRTLGRIAIQEKTNLFHAKTIRALIDYGLIYPVQLNGSGGFVMTVYEMPIYAHIAWCEWCSKQEEATNG